MTPCEAAWVAGIIEGEGCVTWDAKGQPGITVTSTDYDIIERLAAWTGLGVVRSLRVRGAMKKPAWIWTVSNHAGFLELTDAIHPWMLSRRSSRLREVCALFAEHQAVVAERKAAKFIPGEGICKAGLHDKAVTGVYPQGNCAECDRIRCRANKSKNRVAV